MAALCQALFEAVRAENAAAVHRLIAEGADVNCSARVHPRLDAYPILHHAVTKNNRDIVNALLDARADPNVPNITGFTPLMTAIEYKPFHVEPLIAHGADVNSQLMSDGSRRTALYIAANVGSIDAAKQLLVAGANINLASKFGTPLIIATRNGNIPMIRYLLSWNPDLTIRDEITGQTAREQAHYGASTIFDEYEQYQGNQTNTKRKARNLMKYHLTLGSATPAVNVNVFANESRPTSEILKNISAVPPVYKVAALPYNTHVGEAITGLRGNYTEQMAQLREKASRPFGAKGVGGKRKTKKSGKRSARKRIRKTKQR